MAVATGRGDGRAEVTVAVAARVTDRTGVGKGVIVAGVHCTHNKASRPIRFRLNKKE